MNIGEILIDFLDKCGVNVIFEMSPQKTALNVKSTWNPPIGHFVLKILLSKLEKEVFSDCMFLSCHVRVSEWIHTLKLPECQGTPCSKQARNLKVKWLQLDSNPEPLSKTSRKNWFQKLKWYRTSSFLQFPNKLSKKACLSAFPASLNSVR